MQLTRANRRILIIVGVGSLLVVAGVLGWLGPVKWVLDHTVLPAGRGLAAAGSATSETVGNLTHVSDLARRNSELARENATLRQRLAADAETRRDNEALRRELGLQVAGALRQVAAEVVAFDPG